MADWKLKYNNKEISCNYQIYQLTDGKTEYFVHEIQYRNRIFRGSSLEKVVGNFVKMIERKEKK